MANSEKPAFPVVGIGASAGGLEPLEELFAALAGDLDMAFIVVQHSDPAHETLLPAILARRTKMPVFKAKQGEPIESGHVYVCPSDAILTVKDGRFQLTQRTKTPPVLAIDEFFRSLAEHYRNCAVGVILSGTGSDGSAGVREIKEKGGITFAQDERTSKFYSMPQHAMETGAVDFALSAAAMAESLGKIAKHDYLKRAPSADASPDSQSEIADFKVLLKLIHAKSGIDFSQYKQGTVSRRVARRMALHNIRTIADFTRFLRDNPEGVKAMSQDILIQVTKFFREPEIFELLKENTFPSLLLNRPPGEPFRAWVPGCSSGEEVYSLMMCLMEFLTMGGHRFPIQFFGTDLNDEAVTKARNARYLENISADVSPGRLKNFFNKSGSSYEVQKSLRDNAIFARHNLVIDPPFGKLDLISCRNVLIYLEPALQHRALTIFHYALKPKGVLILGNAETAGAASDLFVPIDARNRFYGKKLVSSRLFFDFAGARQTSEKISAPIVSPYAGDSVSKGVQMQRDADRFLMGEYVPASVLVSESLEIVQFRGRTGPYFEHSPGFASFDLLGMLKSGLVTDVKNAIETARTNGTSVRKEEVRLHTEESMSRVAIEVFPMSLPSTGEQYFILLFEDMDAPRAKSSKLRREQRALARPAEGDLRDLTAIRLELATTKEYLQSVNEEKEATNEELKAANEEIMSSNEELQSTNEELHSAKEELQSTNEELMTVNEELKLRNQDLSVLNDDLSNIFQNLNSAVILLTKDLRVRRFTPMAEKLFRLQPADVGRSIHDIRPNVDVKDLRRMLDEVIETVVPKALEVQDEGGRWYSVQIKPYRTNDDRINGAVLTFMDVTELKSCLKTLTERP